MMYTVSMYLVRLFRWSARTRLYRHIVPLCTCVVTLTTSTLNDGIVKGAILHIYRRASKRPVKIGHRITLVHPHAPHARSRTKRNQRGRGLALRRNMLCFSRDARPRELQAFGKHFEGSLFHVTTLTPFSCLTNLPFRSCRCRCISSKRLY